MSGQSKEDSLEEQNLHECKYRYNFKPKCKSIFYIDPEIVFHKGEGRTLPSVAQMDHSDVVGLNLREETVSKGPNGEDDEQTLKSALDDKVYELEKIDDLQIESGIVLLNDRHPLVGKEIDQILPYLKNCCRKKKRDSSNKVQQEDGGTFRSETDDFCDKCNRSTTTGTLKSESLYKPDRQQFIKTIFQSTSNAADRLREMRKQVFREHEQQRNEEADKKVKDQMHLDFLRVWLDSDEEDLPLLYDSIRINQDKKIQRQITNLKASSSMLKTNNQSQRGKFGGQLEKLISDWRVQNNPFLSYGIGIQNYFNLQGLLIRLLAICCMFTIPQMIIYASMDGTGTKYKDASYINWLMQKISFGNMGYSKNICSSVYIDWSKEGEDAGVTLNFNCQRTTKIMNVISTGVNSA